MKSTKKTLSVLLCIAMLFALSTAVFARNEDIVISTSGTTWQVGGFGYYNSITVKSGANAVFPDAGFEIVNALIVEDGATLTGTAGSSDFIFSILSPDAVVSGIDLYWENRDTGEIKKVPGGFPSIAALDLWDFSGGWCPSFKWSSTANGWCLTIPLNGNPFGEKVYHSERDMDTAARFADRLHTLGLFSGTGTGADGRPTYELDRTGTRAEAVVMLVRFMGGEAEAKSGVWAHPFTDVPDWAAPYVGYAYQAGWTAGTSDTTFSPFDTCSAQMYMTFLLRALGYSVTDVSVYTNALSLARQHGIYSTEQDPYEIYEEAFWRADMVAASYRLLEIERLDGQKLADKLIGDGVFTADAYRCAA